MNSIVLPPSNKRKASFIVSTTIEVAGESSYFFLKGRFFPAYFVIPSLFLYIRGGVVRTCQSKCLEPFCPLCFGQNGRHPERDRKNSTFLYCKKIVSLQHDTHCAILPNYCSQQEISLSLSHKLIK